MSNLALCNLLFEGAELNALQREHRLSYHGLDESRDSSTAEALIDPDTVESSRYFLHQVSFIISK